MKESERIADAKEIWGRIDWEIQKDDKLYEEVYSPRKGKAGAGAKAEDSEGEEDGGDNPVGYQGDDENEKERVGDDKAKDEGVVDEEEGEDDDESKVSENASA